jgi:hypothetical protein
LQRLWWDLSRTPLTTSIKPESTKMLPL